MFVYSFKLKLIRTLQRSCLLITLHYIDQICARYPSFTLSSLTCHRFVITAIAVSSKALCDAFCTNNLYAKVGGIPVGELNMLEREFLRMIDWTLTVSLPLPSISPHPTPTTIPTKKKLLENPSAPAKSSKNTTPASSARTARARTSSSGPTRRAASPQTATRTTKWRRHVPRRPRPTRTAPRRPSPSSSTPPASPPNLRGLPRSSRTWPTPRSANSRAPTRGETTGGLRLLGQEIGVVLPFVPG